MTAPLTPALALDYLHAMSADVRAAVVLAGDGQCLAGPPALGDAARAVLAPGPGGELGPGPTQLEGATDAGAVYAARDHRYAIVAVVGTHALARLTRHDLRSALAALSGDSPIETTPTRLSHAAVSALLSAADEHFRRPRAV